MKSNALKTLAILATSFLGTAYAISPNGAQEQYEQLSSPEMILERTIDGHAIVGANLAQKNEADGSFCRKGTAVVPRPVPSYACYTEVANSTDAQELFEGAPERAMQVMFYLDDHPLVGRSWEEKTIRNSRFGDDLLCVKTRVIAPGAPASYACYRNFPRVGGGISVGN